MGEVSLTFPERLAVSRIEHLKEDNESLRESVKMLTRGMEQSAETEAHLMERNAELEAALAEMALRLVALRDENARLADAEKTRVAERILYILQNRKRLAYVNCDNEPFTVTSYLQEPEPCFETAEMFVSMIYAEDISIWEECRRCDRPYGTPDLAILHPLKFCRATEYGCHERDHDGGCTCEVN